MKIKRSAILGEIIFPSISAWAGGMAFRPGLWQISSQSEYVGNGSGKGKLIACKSTKK